MEANNVTKENTTLWEDFQNGRAYQSNVGLTQKIPLYVRFYEGDQWPKPTPNTQGLPRPVVNMIKMICRNKKSAILSTPVKMVYQAEQDNVDVVKFNRFSDYIQKELGQEDLDKKAIDSGVKKGGYFYHYYWDSEARGKSGNKIGAVRCEMIDILNIFFADPTEDDEQKQRWILIASREPVSSVRAKCDKDVDPETIAADEAEDPYGKSEQEDSELVTVLTRYFRKDGEVYIEKATKSVVINKPFPLTPDFERARASLDRKEPDAPNDDLPDRPSAEKEPLIPKRAKATLYPIVVGNYEPKEKCIYGLGEIEGLIQNQRSINFNIAMMLLAAQENGWGKYVVNKDALQGQVITNEPGQVLTDYTPGGNGIKRLSEHTMPSAPMQIVETLVQMTRAVTGSSEVMTGETIGSNMSGAAIAQLQSQALQPVEDLKDTFWKVKKKQGKVLAQFYKLFYHERDFSYTEEVELSNADRMMLTPESEITPKTKKKKFFDVFRGREFSDVDFEVIVEATGGTKASAAGDINALDMALSNGGISLKTYFELYPKDALSNRSEILEKLSSEEANKVMAMQAQIEQLTEQLKQSSAMLEEREKQLQEQQQTVDRVASMIRENQSLKTMLAELYTEASEKIRDANIRLAAGGANLRQTQADARIMAEEIAKTEQQRQPMPQATTDR